MAIQMRQGNEVDFDAEKMLPGEWAVSTDAKIVRICFAPGIVARIATYEAFEADMVKIEAILKNVQDIQTAVKLVQAEINGKSELVAENASLAEEYMLKSKEYAEQAGAFTGMQIAKRDLLGVVKGGDMAVEDDGALRNFKRGAGNTFAVSDTVESPFSAYKLYGKSVQETVAGNQLIEPKLESGVSNGVTITRNNDGSYTLNGTATANASFRIDQSTVSGRDNLKSYKGEYTISLDGNTNDNVRLVLMKYPEYSGWLDSHVTPTATLDVVDCFVYISVLSGTTLNNYVVKPMLNAGTVPLPWEPYTGGSPSPNPSYPQEIKSVVADKVKVCGKNLFDTSKIINGKYLNAENYSYAISDNAAYWITDFIRCFAGENIAWNIVPHTFTIYDENKNPIKNVYYGTSGTGYNYTIPENGAYIVFCYKLETVPVTSELIINYGSEPLPYEPYTENTATLSQPITLHGIGDVRDELTPDGVVRKFKKVVFDGSDDEEWEDAKGNAPFGIKISDIKPTLNGNLPPNAICTHYIPVSNVADWTQYDYLMSYFGGDFTLIRFRNIGISSLDEWKAELHSNPITVVYELAEPIIEPLSEADQIAIRSLHSYDGVTTVMSDAWAEVECATSNVAALAMYIKRDYVPKAKYDALESRISALEQQIVNA